MSQEARSVEEQLMNDLKEKLTTTQQTKFQDSFSEEVWMSTYKDFRDKDVNDTFFRVAQAVASVEDSLEKRLEWTEKFYDLLSDFKATCGGRIYANAGTDWKGTTLMNCFTSDALVLTEHGYKPISEIKVGEKVMTHTGNWRTVVNCLVRDYEGEIFKIENDYLVKPLFVTPEHPFYQGNDVWESAEKINSCIISSNNEEKNYVEIDITNFLQEKINKELIKYDNEYFYISENKPASFVKRKLLIDEDFAYVLGRFVGDGSTSKHKSKDFEKHIIDICFSNKEQIIADQVKNVLEQRLGTNFVLTGKTDSYFRIQKYSPIIATLFREFVGDNFKTKRVPTFIWKSPSSVKEQFLLGLFDADGFIAKGGSLRLTLANYDLLQQTQLLFMSIGILSTLRQAPMAKTNKHQSWYLYIAEKSAEQWRQKIRKVYFDERNEKHNTNSTSRFSIENNLMQIPIKKTKLNFTGKVYNLSVEVDESYVVNGIIVHNCYVGPRVQKDPDSLDGILDHLRAQAHTLKSEGGWGENFSYIRPRGSFIHGIGVETPGAVKYMELFDKSSDIITAGSGRKSENPRAKGKIRKGAMMGVLDCWHPDIIEFITAKQQPGRLTKFNVSVNCTDEFMNRVVQIVDIEKQITKENNSETPNNELIKQLKQKKEQLDKWDLRFPDTTFEKYKEEWNGDLKYWEAKGYPVKVYNTVSVMWLWNLIMESTYNRAEPGVLFLDRANYYLPLNYKETIYATNPSMPAGTLVHTKDGIFPIEQLEGKTFFVKSLDGQWAEATCRLSGNNEQLLEINFGANRIVRSTKEHRWPVYDARAKRLYKVDASDLKPGDLIPLNRNENIGVYGDMTLTYDEGFFVGCFLGRGHFIKKQQDEFDVGIVFNSQEITIANKVLSIVNSMKSVPSTLCQKDNDKIYLQFSCEEIITQLTSRYKIYPGIKTIPDSIWQGNDNYIKGFVDGLLSISGKVFFNKNNQKIIFTSSKEKFVKEFAKLLGFAGIPVFVWYKNMEKSKSFNNQPRRKIYKKWSVVICGKAILNFCNVFDITYPDKQQTLKEILSFFKTKQSTKAQQFIKVVSIKPVNTAKVWDISVKHDQHVFPTEWCYTGNCGEQTLAPGGVCNLGSLNLTQFIKEDRTGFDLEKLDHYTRYMVRFLDNVNTLTNAPLVEYSESIKNKRRIGIGILGWGSALYMLKTRFASEQANEFREGVMSTIARAAYEASIDLAKEKGMFPLCDPEKHAEAVFIKQLGLTKKYIDKLRRYGIRNSSLLSIQPTGNTSIFANVVSGGLEPVFLHEYIRTVIVNTVPEEIADVCPKWYEGAWHETEMFKFTKEGDEEILRGVAKDGTVYKIDKNRGLTKEVLCEDYGVRFMKKIGEWDPTMPWAITAMSMTVKDHVNDLTGFARWIDSSISKTINVPYDYPFDDFKNIYLDAYNSQYVKGVTTYRSGTMTTVLAAKDEKNATNEDEEIILDDVKLPDSSPATMKILKAEGRKWYLTVIWNETQTRPLALFVHTNSHEKNITTTNAIEVLVNLAYKKGIPSKHIEASLQKTSGDNNATKIARIISLNLRHGVLIKNIVRALDTVEGVTVGSFLFQIKKFLSTFIRDGEKVEDAKCDNCGSQNIVYSEGCMRCNDCGSSKCG